MTAVIVTAVIVTPYLCKLHLGLVFSASQDAAYSLLQHLFDLAFTFELLTIVQYHCWQYISLELFLTMLASTLVVMLLLAEPSLTASKVMLPQFCHGLDFAYSGRSISKGKAHGTITDRTVSDLQAGPDGVGAYGSGRQ